MHRAYPVPVLVEETAPSAADGDGNSEWEVESEVEAEVEAQVGMSAGAGSSSAGSRGSRGSSTQSAKSTTGRTQQGSEDAHPRQAQAQALNTSANAFIATTTTPGKLRVRLGPGAAVSSAATATAAAAAAAAAASAGMARTSSRTNINIATTDHGIQRRCARPSCRRVELVPFAGSSSAAFSDGVMDLLYPAHAASPSGSGLSPDSGSGEYWFCSRCRGTYSAVSTPLPQSFSTTREMVHHLLSRELAASEQATSAPNSSGSCSTTGTEAAAEMNAAATSSGSAPFSATLSQSSFFEPLLALMATSPR